MKKCKCCTNSKTIICASNYLKHKLSRAHQQHQIQFNWFKQTQHSPQKRSHLFLVWTQTLRQLPACWQPTHWQGHPWWQLPGRVRFNPVWLKHGEDILGKLILEGWLMGKSVKSCTCVIWSKALKNWLIGTIYLAAVEKNWIFFFSFSFFSFFLPLFTHMLLNTL